jgi:hypothetical protein
MPVGLTLIKVGWFRGATCREGSNRNKSSMSPTLLAFDLMKSLAAPAVKREPREEGAVLPGPHPRELKPPVSRGSEPRLAHKFRRGSPCRTAGSGRSPGTEEWMLTLALLLRCESGFLARLSVQSLLRFGMSLFALKPSRTICASNPSARTALTYATTSSSSRTACG